LSPLPYDYTWPEKEFSRGAQVMVRLNHFLPKEAVRVVGGEIHCGSFQHLARIVYKVNVRRARLRKRRRRTFGPPPVGGWKKWNDRVQLYHPHARKRRR
jgi:hypothetical protein